MVLNLMIGLLHPPMGMVLFVLARVAKLSVERTTMAILPWLVPLLGSLFIITYVPNGALAAEEVLLGGSSCNDRHEPLHPPASRTTTSLIARIQLVGGTKVENFAVRGLIPAGHKVAARDIAQRQAGAPLQPDHRLRQQADRGRRARAHAQPRHGPRQGRLRARLRLWRRREARAGAARGNLHGHQARRRPRRDAQLHRRAVQRELLGDAARAIADHFSRQTNPQALADYPNVDGVVALRQIGLCVLLAQIGSFVPADGQ